MSIWAGVRDYVNNLHFLFGFKRSVGPLEVDDSFNGRVDGVVASHEGVLSRVELHSLLSYNDIVGQHLLVSLLLEASSLACWSSLAVCITCAHLGGKLGELGGIM